MRGPPPAVPLRALAPTHTPTMPVSPKSPSAMMRSLGADESALEAKLRVSAREAEQRWPLFRAMAPVKGEAPPAMSTTDKQAWEETPHNHLPERKPLLARPGISSKLSSGLQKFAAMSGATPRVNNSTRSRTPVPDEQPISAVRSKQRSTSLPTGPVETEAVASTLFPAKKLPANRDALFATATTPQAPAGKPVSGLFAKSPTKTPATGAPTQRSDSKLFAEEAPSDSLSALFHRVEGHSVATPTTTPSTKGANPIMRRIGKR